MCRTNNLSAYTLSSSRACSEYLAIYDVINFVWFERRWRPIDQCADTIINWLHRGRRHPCTKDALRLGARQYQAAGALACARRCSTSLQQYGHGTRGPLWENTEPEVHNISQRCRRRIELRPRLTCLEYLLQIGRRVVPETCSQTERQKYSSQTLHPTCGGVTLQCATLRVSVPRHHGVVFTTIPCCGCAQ